MQRYRKLLLNTFKQQKSESLLAAITKASHHTQKITNNYPIEKNHVINHMILSQEKSYD